MSKPSLCYAYEQYRKDYAKINLWSAPQKTSRPRPNRWTHHKVPGDAI